MADTYTTSLRLQLQQTGNNSATWGAIADIQYQLLEAAITGDNGYAGGSGGINIAGLSTYTLTVAQGTADQSRQLLYPFVGALTANCTVTIPGVVKVGWILNATTGGYNVIVKVGAGASLTVAPGGWNFFYCDGVNVTAPSLALAAPTFPSGITVTGTAVLNSNATVGGTLGVTGNSTLTGSATIGGPLTVTGSSSFNASGTALQVPNGTLIANVLQSTGATAGTESGWAYTPTGPGAASGTYNFGVIASGFGMLATNFFATSDERLKSNIKTISPADGEQFVKTSRPVTYIKAGAPGAGFISQEQIKAGYGEYVATMPHEGLPPTTDADGLISHPDVALHLDYNNYIAYLTAALQSALLRIEALERG